MGLPTIDVQLFKGPCAQPDKCSAVSDTKTVDAERLVCQRSLARDRQQLHFSMRFRMRGSGFNFVARVIELWCSRGSELVWHCERPWLKSYSERNSPNFHFYSVLYFAYKHSPCKSGKSLTSHWAFFTRGRIDHFMCRTYLGHFLFRPSPVLSAISTKFWTCIIHRRFRSDGSIFVLVPLLFL